MEEEEAPRQSRAVSGEPLPAAGAADGLGLRHPGRQTRDTGGPGGSSRPFGGAGDVFPLLSPGEQPGPRLLGSGEGAPSSGAEGSDLPVQDFGNLKRVYTMQNATTRGTSETDNLLE